jgi:hypothetical protein
MPETNLVAGAAVCSPHEFQPPQRHGVGIDAHPVAESYRGKRFDGMDKRAMRLLGGTLLTLTEHRESLIAAGFVDVDVFEERQRGWMCAVGRLEK